MPVPQAFPCNREVRFTLRLRQPITIARKRDRLGQRKGHVGKIWEMKSRAHPPACEARASANTSGPDPTTGQAALDETADRFDPHRTKKLGFFCRTVSSRFENSIQPLT
jgi:hypothetical protein